MGSDAHEPERIGGGFDLPVIQENLKTLLPVWGGVSTPDGLPADKRKKAKQYEGVAGQSTGVSCADVFLRMTLAVFLRLIGLERSQSTAGGVPHLYADLPGLR